MLFLYFFSLSALFSFFFFFFNDPATTEIYTLSLHDALPIFRERRRALPPKSTIRSGASPRLKPGGGLAPERIDRKSTRLNSSHLGISYAVFCLKKKKKKKKHHSKQIRQQLRHTHI